MPTVTPAVPTEPASHPQSPTASAAIRPEPVQPTSPGFDGSSGSGGFDGFGGIGDDPRDPGDLLVAILGNLRDWASDQELLTVAVLPIAVAGYFVVREWWQYRCHTRRAATAHQVTVLTPPTVDPAGGTALWSNLVGVLRPAWRRALTGQPHLAYEYVFSDTEAAIRLWVPGVIPPGLVERAIEAAWPGAQTHVDAVHTPLPTAGDGRRPLVIGGQLRLARSEALPIRAAFDADPLRALIGASAGLGPDEYACVQILARPAAGRRVTRARRTARRARARGSSHLASHNLASHHLAGRLLDAVTAAVTIGPARRTAVSPRRDPQTSLEYSAQDRVIVNKQRSSQYETVIRYAVATVIDHDSDKAAIRAAQDVTRGRAHALAATFACYTDHNRYTRNRLRRPAKALSSRRLRRGDLLSVPELAAVAHLPTDDAIPGIQRAGARALAPPPGIASHGPDTKPLGVTNTGRPRPVALRVPDARHHMHIIGATGTGKSTLLANLALADAEAGRGIVLIDPKGDLVTDILSRLPSTAADRLVLFDADSTSRPPCLNPLHGGETDLTVDHLVSVFRRVYSAFWGPRTDDVMRAACLTLRAQPGVATLADVPKLLTDPAFRRRITATVTDPVLRGFWGWYDDLTDSARSQVISPLMNKLRAFLLRPFVRDAIAAGPSTVDMPRVLDSGICLVRLPKGSLGEETTRLVGSLVVARTWQAATGRADIPQHKRQDASLLIDECHNFLNLPYPIEDMLAEARGFRVSIALAHQHLGQLPRELRDGISTNARSKIVFTASPDDARELARHTTPRLSDHDLAHLGVYHAAARLILNGDQAQPFTLRTQPLPPPIPGRSRQVRKTARQALRSPHTTQTRSTPPHRNAARSEPASPATSPAGSTSSMGVSQSRGTDPRRRT